MSTIWKVIIVLLAAAILSTQWYYIDQARGRVDTVFIDSTIVISDTVYTVWRYHVLVYTVHINDTIWDTTNIDTTVTDTSFHYGGDYGEPEYGLTMNAIGVDSLVRAKIDLGAWAMYAYLRPKYGPNYRQWTKYDWLDRVVYNDGGVRIYN